MKEQEIKLWRGSLGSSASRLLLRALFALLAGCGGPEIDLIVAGEYVLVMDDRNTIVKDGAVAVDDGRILEVGGRADIAERYRARETLEGNGRVVMPGLVNGHTHAAMTLLRGIADDHELIDWLTNYIFPAEVRFVNEEFVRIGTELACWEMIRGGTTTFVDMYYFPDTVAKVVRDCGLRAIIGSTVIDQKSPDAKSGEQGLEHAEAFVKRWKGKNNRIIPAIAPHAVYTVPPPLLTKVRQKADELGVPVTIHISESRFEIETARKTYDKLPIQHLESLNFFKGPTIGAHVVWPREDEIGILARYRVGVIHNPTSNMKISSGIAPVAQMLAKGVRVGLGTDGPATNNDLDMWEEMRLAAFLQKVETMNPEVLPAAAVLRMATRGGAEALGLEDQIGSLKVGYRADLIQVSLLDLHFVPLHDLVTQLVYVADEQDVRSVVVDGKVLMRNRQVLTVDSERLRKEARVLGTKIRRAIVEGKD